MNIPPISYSMRSLFRSCARKVYFRYVAGIEPIADTKALAIGRAYHSVLEHWRKGEDREKALKIASKDLVTDLRIMGIEGEDAFDILSELDAYTEGYGLMFGDQKEWHYEVEKEFKFANEIAYIDAMTIVDGKAYFIEDKTRASFNSLTESVLKLNEQLINYSKILVGHGYDLGGCLYRECLKTRTSRNKKETRQEYAERIMRLYRNETESRYKQILVTFTEEEIADYCIEQRLTDAVINSSFKLPKNIKYWPRNSSNCIGLYGPCDYYKICTKEEGSCSQFKSNNKEPLDGGEFKNNFFKGTN